MPDKLPAAAITAALEAIARLPQVKAGWAFGVPPEAEEEWLRPVAKAALEAAEPHLTAAATAAERARILVPDETLHDDGSIGDGEVVWHDGLVT